MFEKAIPLAGKAYGYRVVHEGADEAKGRREIVEEEAGIVREIFERYANGEGPRTIAKSLNARGVPGINGRRWVDATIRGHAKKRTGILSNELYSGRIIWNRQQFVRDPMTGNRVARMRPRSEWIVREDPELRIISDEL